MGQDVESGASGCGCDRNDSVPATTVNAGADRTVEVGDTVELDGSSSGNTATHKWQFLSQPTGSAATIQNADQLMGASFVADRVGDYDVELLGAISSDPTAPDVNPAARDTVVITAVSADGGMPSECMDAPGAIVIGDEEFDDADWVHSETHTDGATIATEPTGQEPSGGVDDSTYRSMTHEITNPLLGESGCAEDDCSFTMIVSHQYVAAGGRYTPATDGAIDYIDYSESRIITEPAFTGAGVGWTFVVWQEPVGGGEPVRYRVPGTAFSDVTWSSESLCGLTPQDFGPEGLNFEDGGTMTFGYSRSNTNTTPNRTQKSVHGIDNFRVGIVKQ